MNPGTHLNHCEILSPLGKGGMGEVWLAQGRRHEDAESNVWLLKINDGGR